MKTTVLRSKFRPLILLLAMLVIMVSFVGNPIETRKLTAETNHSTLLFSVPISNGITRITGKFNEYTIDLDYVDADFTKSVLSATVKVNSIDTGISGRDEHLRSPDFFNAEVYPEISFRSNRIEKTEDGYVAIGNFSMHGVNRELELPFVITGVDGDNTIGISSRLTIDRTIYGVGNDFKHSAIENFISNKIDVEIDFWTKKRKTPKKE
ncbi:MAG: YceI family protein [Flavobacterium sp.]|nr:MAG: YceI family protein [Flavobacterium sp.]